MPLAYKWGIQVGYTELGMVIQPVGLVRYGKSIFIGAMGNQFHCYHIKGKKTFTVYLDSHITQVTRPPAFVPYSTPHPPLPPHTLF
eukprot:COSAG05_NODE_3271_length_2186_cov_459.916188_2_plen_86_part_00